MNEHKYNSERNVQTDETNILSTVSAVAALSSVQPQLIPNILTKNITPLVISSIFEQERKDENETIVIVNKIILDICGQKYITNGDGIDLLYKGKQNLIDDFNLNENIQKNELINILGTYFPYGIDKIAE